MMEDAEGCPYEGKQRQIPPTAVSVRLFCPVAIGAIMVFMGTAGLMAQDARGMGVVPMKPSTVEYGAGGSEIDAERTMEQAGEGDIPSLARKPTPLFGMKRAIIQPLIGVAFVTPWIVHLAVSGNKSKKFFKRGDELALYLATPLAMSFTISMSGWLIDSRSYNFFAGFGISTGLGYFGAGMGQLFIAMFCIAPGWWNKSMRTYYIIATVFSGWITIVATIGGDILGKMLSRKRAHLQAALVQGEDGGLSMGVPLPIVYTEGRNGEVNVSLSLLYYRF